MATAFAFDPVQPRQQRQIPITVDQVAAMIDASVDGIDRAELIDGELIEMSAQKFPHIRSKVALQYRLHDALKAAGSPLVVAAEVTFVANRHAMPQPDIAVYEPWSGSGFLPAANLRLVVEVCITSHDLDFRRKPALYATAGIPEYWVADLGAREIVLMWSPDSGTYTQRLALPFGVPVTSIALGVEIATDGLG